MPCGLPRGAALGTLQQRLLLGACFAALAPASSPAMSLAVQPVHMPTALRSSAHVRTTHESLLYSGRPPRRLPFCVSAFLRTCRPLRGAHQGQARRPFGMRRQPLGCTPCQPIAGRHLDGRHWLGCACNCPPPYTSVLPVLPYLRCSDRPLRRLHLCQHTCKTLRTSPQSEQARPFGTRHQPVGQTRVEDPTPPRIAPLPALTTTTTMAT